MNRRNFLHLTPALLGTAIMVPGAVNAKNLSNGFRKRSIAKKPENGYTFLFKNDILEWMEKVRFKEEGWGRWKYNLNMGRDYALEASEMAICILDILNALYDIDDKSRNEGIEFFQSCQDKHDKFFKDPLLTEKDKIKDKHTWEHIYANFTKASINALNLLGAEPLYGLREWTFVDYRITKPRDWIKMQDWTDPWMYSEHLYRSLKSYWLNLPENERNKDESIVKDLLSGYEELIIDPATGMPIKGGCLNKAVAMAGLFKSTMAYRMVGREVPYADNAIDYILELQDSKGGFGDGWARDFMCIEWDAMWLLYHLDIQLEGSYRHDEIVNAGLRNVTYLIRNYRKEDGAFSFNKDSTEPIQNSIHIGKEYPLSDIHGTLYCLRNFSYVDDWTS